MILQTTWTDLCVKICDLQYMKQSNISQNPCLGFVWFYSILDMRASWSCSRHVPLPERYPNRTKQCLNKEFVPTRKRLQDTILYKVRLETTAVTSMHHVTHRISAFIKRLYQNPDKTCCAAAVRAVQSVHLNILNLFTIKLTILLGEGIGH